MKLSKRLECIAGFVPQGSVVADIGTDHGYIPIYLLTEGISPKAYAMDVGKGPLERAKEHVKEYGLEDKITLRLSDGLKQLEPGEADTVVIAGMGGQLICRILEDGKRLWETTRRFIISPQSELSFVRHYLAESGFQIVREEMLAEDGKYYVVMELIYDGTKKEAMEEHRYEYGSYLIDKKHPVLKELLKKEHQALTDIIRQLPEGDSSARDARRQELADKIRRIEVAQSEMQ